MNNKIKETRNKIIKDFKVPGYSVGPELEFTKIDWLISSLRMWLKWNIIFIKSFVKWKIKCYFKNLLRRKNER